MDKLVIWTYHRVLPKPGRGAVSVRELDAHIRFLKALSYNFITATEVGDWLEGRLDRRKKYAALTFDDGWADNLAWATPVLRRHGARATLALSTSLANPAERGFKLEDEPERLQIKDFKTALGEASSGADHGQFLTWGELERMRDGGVWETQAHGHTHLGCYHDVRRPRGFHPAVTHWTMAHALGSEPFAGAPRGEFKSVLSHPMTRLADDFVAALKSAASDEERMEACRSFPNPIEETEDNRQFRERVAADLNKCRALMKERLGLEPECLFWPWGDHSDAGVETAAACGFRTTFSTRKAAVTPDSDRLRLPRVAAPGGLFKFARSHFVFTSGLLSKLREVFTSK